MLRGVGFVGEEARRRALEEEALTREEQDRQRAEEDRQRGIQAEEEAKAGQAFQTQLALRDDQLASAAQRPESEVFPMQMPEFQFDPATGAMKPQEGSLPPRTTGAIPIPEHLQVEGGPAEVGGRQIETLEDVQGRQQAAARGAAEGAREVERGLGDRTTVTQEMVDQMPEGYRGVFQPFVGREIETDKWNEFAAGAGLAHLKVEQGLAAEGRQEAAQARGEVRRMNLKQSLIGQELTPEARQEFLNASAKGWRDYDASKLSESNFSTRTGLNRSKAKMLANKYGVVIPDRDTHKITMAAKGELADIEELQNLMADPEVREWLGAYAGRVTNWAAKGWLAPLGDVPVPQKVWTFRSNLNTLAASTRHDIYGAAVTGTEVPFAEGFIPSMTQGINAMQANIQEARDQIERGLDARWGSPGGEAAPEEPQATGSAEDPLGIL
jgi:hypothetical protein